MSVPNGTRILAFGQNVALVQVPSGVHAGRADGIATMYAGNLYYYPSGTPMRGYTPYGTKALRTDKRAEARGLEDAAVAALAEIGVEPDAGNGGFDTPDTPDADAGNPAGRALETLLVSAVGAAIASGIGDSVKDDVLKHVVETLGFTPRRIVVETPDDEIEIEGITHPAFTDVVFWLLNGENVYIYGPAGSGKSTMMRQVAAALGVEFYFFNAITDIYAQLLGARYLDGEFVPTPLYEAWKNGNALVFVDEFDASIPEAATFLQNALENGLIAFPNGETVEKSGTCYFAAAGNTALSGADLLHNARYQQDAAIADRFLFIQVGYSTEIEDALASGDTAISGFVRDFRHAIAEAGTHHLATPRAIRRIRKGQNHVSDVSLLRSALTKNLDRDDLTVLRSKMNGSGRWYDALDALIASL